MRQEYLQQAELCKETNQLGTIRDTETIQGVPPMYREVGCVDWVYVCKFHRTWDPRTYKLLLAHES